MANGQKANVAGTGEATIMVQNADGQYLTAVFADALCCPEFETNLVSWKVLQKKGFTLLQDCAGVVSPGGHVFPLEQAEIGPRFVTRRPDGEEGGVAVAAATVLCTTAAAAPEAKTENAGAAAAAAAKAADDDAAERTAAKARKAVETKLLHHRRLGHLHEGAMNKLISGGLGTGVDYTAAAQLPVCVPCRVMKSHRIPLKEGMVQSKSGKQQRALPVTSYKALKFWKRKNIHFVDIFGPVRPAGIGGVVCKLGLMHAITGVIKVYSMLKKSATLTLLQTYHTNVMPIAELRTDNEAVFRSAAVKEWTAASGIRLSHCAPYTPEQLATIERAWRTLGEGACAMMYESTLPDEFWGFAMDTMAYVYNRTPRDSNEEGVSPMQAAVQMVPELADLRVFGCRVFLHVPKERRLKMEPKARLGIHVGYQPANNTYMVWVPEDGSNVLKGRLYESRDVTFDETWRYRSREEPAAPVGEEESSGAESEEEQAPAAAEQDGDSEQGAAKEGLLRQTELTREALEWWRSGSQSVASEVAAADAPQREDEYFAAMVTGAADPTEWDVFHGPEAPMWRESYDRERTSLLAREVYDSVLKEQVLRETHKKILKTMAVRKKKFLADGSIDKHKTRVCVNGAAQRAAKGDFTEGELFAPTAKFTSLRTMIALAAANGWELRQFDVETAFLYAPLEEEIYVSPPAGFEEYDGEGRELVWKLKKSLYGLRQSPRNWYQEFSGFLTAYGVSKNPHDPCVYTFKDQTGELKCMLIVYVDDVPSGIAGDAEWYKQFLSDLKAKYNIKEGPLEWCLGIEVVRGEDYIELKQTKYINDMLVKYDMEQCTGASVPLAAGSVFSYQDSPQTPEEKAVMQRMPCSQYKSLVGSLLYAAVGTRPDIALAVSKISHVMSKPGPTHYRRATHLLRYLKKTKDLGLRFTKVKEKQRNVLIGYADADYAGCVDSRRSTTGFFFMLNGGPVSWHCKLQSTVAMSTTEAEYMSLSTSASDAVFLRGLLKHMTFEQKEPTTIFEDNFGCECLTKDEVLHTRTKHIDIRYHKIRELVKDGTVAIESCPTEEMVADILTKLLTKPKFEDFRARLLGYSASA